MTEDDKKRRKREDILLAARAVFSQKGYHQTTVEEIAERAGVAKGTVYLYFPSKANLLLECLRQIFEALSAKMRQIVADNETKEQVSATDILRQTVAAYLDHLNRNKDIIRLALMQLPSVAKEMDDEDAKLHIRKMPWVYVDHVEQGLSKGMDAGLIKKANPRIMALAMLGAAQNIALYHLYNHPEKDLNELTEDIVQVVKGMIISEKQEEK